MCKKIALCLMVLFNALTVWGQKEVLKFNRDGKKNASLFSKKYRNFF